jgi:hypothetical protein
MLLISTRPLALLKIACSPLTPVTLSVSVVALKVKAASAPSTPALLN